MLEVIMLTLSCNEDNMNVRHLASSIGYLIYTRH